MKIRDFETCHKLFIERLREYIKTKNVNVETFAKSVEISPRTVYAWLKKETIPGMEHLTGLAQKLGWSAGYLIGIEE